MLTSAVRGEGPAGGAGAGHAVTAARGAAIEVAVHGWDLATACGSRRPMPPGLVSALLASASPLVDDGARPHVFAAPVDVPPDACAEDRLVAFLGRQPTTRPHREGRSPAPMGPRGPVQGPAPRLRGVGRTGSFLSW